MATLPSTLSTSAAAAVLIAFVAPPEPPTLALLYSRRIGEVIASAVPQSSRAEMRDVGVPEPPTAAPGVLTGTADSIQVEADRPTSPREDVVGEIRSWFSFSANWDGEGAKAPDMASLKQASAFVGLLEMDAPDPDPMLLASGHAGLYWNDGELYADLEFLGNGRLTYYIERRDGQKHKGVVNFDGSTLPPGLPALLSA